MAVSKNIKKPPFPLDEHRFKGCLTWVDKALTYYINRRCKARLLYSFWFNYAESPYYEDPSRENDFYPTLTDFGGWVQYSETIVLKNEDAAGRDQRHPRGYRESDHRLDFYVTKSEFAQAYREIQKLGRKRGDERVMEAIIFRCLRVVLVEDSRFGEKSEKPVP